LTEDDDVREFKVIVNDEQQYSLWPAGRANAPGWRDTGKVGTKEACIAHIEEVWTDMTPLSLRRKMRAVR
jgi:MbtH protein